LPSRPDRRQTAVWLVEGGDEPGKEIGEGLAVVIGPAAHGRRELAAPHTRGQAAVARQVRGW
jgi:hypothetical protein